MASEIVEEESSQSSEDRVMPAGNSLFTSFDYYDYGQTGLGSQGFANQGLGNQGLGNLGLGNQGLGNQGLGNQGLGNQGLANQGLANQGLLNQGLGYQSLQGLLGNTRLANQNRPVYNAQNLYLICILKNIFLSDPIIRNKNFTVLPILIWIYYIHRLGT